MSKQCSKLLLLNICFKAIYLRIIPQSWQMNYSYGCNMNYILSRTTSHSGSTFLLNTSASGWTVKMSLQHFPDYLNFTKREKNCFLNKYYKLYFFLEVSWHLFPKCPVKNLKLKMPSSEGYITLNNKNLYHSSYLMKQWFL